MLPPKQILIAVDLKSWDQDLLNQGLCYAQAFNSKVWIIHVAAPDPDFVGYDAGPDYIRDSRATELKKEHQLIQEHMQFMEKHNVDCEGLLIQGPTIEMLMEEVNKLNVDLLIMGEKKHGILYTALMGSTSSKILKNIAIPVLIIPLSTDE